MSAFLSYIKRDDTKKKMKCFFSCLKYLGYYIIALMIGSIIAPETVVTSALIGNLLVLIYLHWYYKTKGEKFLVQFQFFNFDLKKLGITLLSGALFTLVVQGIPLLFPKGIREMLLDQDVSCYMEQDRFVTFLGLVLAGPIVEELLFRILILKKLKEAMDVREAVLVQAAMFGVLHFNIITGLMTFVAGIFYGYLNEKLDSKMPSVCIHIFNNALAFFSVLYV